MWKGWIGIEQSKTGIWWKEGQSLLSVELNNATWLAGLHVRGCAHVWKGEGQLIELVRGRLKRTRVANNVCSGWRLTMRSFREQPEGNFRKTETF